MPRPSQNILSTSAIARAALALVEEKGDFTIPGIARALKVNPSSLYHHLPGGRLEIIHRMREELYARIDVQALRDGTRSPEERLRAWMGDVRAALATAPGVVIVLVSSPVQDALTLAIYEALFEILRDIGIPVDRRMAFAAMIDAVVLGSAVDAGSPVPLWQADPAENPELFAAAAREDDASRASAGFALAVDVAIAAVHAAAVTTSP